MKTMHLAQMLLVLNQTIQATIRHMPVI